MKDIKEYINNNKWIKYMIISIIGIIVSIPLFWIQIKETDDGWFHLIRLIGLDNSIQDSSFPFLIAPYLCRNFGYSINVFYPPIVTYVPYIIGAILESFNIGLKIFTSLTIIFSGIFMYNFINEVTKNDKISFLAAFIYMVIPYRFEVIYNRFAIGEFTAFVFIPVVFQGLYNLLNGDRKKHFYIAIGAIGLLLSHTISTLYTALFCAIYVIYNIKKFFNKDVIKKCIVNVVFILLVSAFFIIPMFEFKGQAKYSIFEPAIMKTGGEYVQTKTIELWQLLKDKGEKNGVSFIVGIPTLVMFFISILAYKHIDKAKRNFWIENFIFGILSLFMCTKAFPWLHMPQILCNIQYPWRLIGFAMFFFAPVFAMNIYYLSELIKNEKIKKIVYIIVIAIILVFTILRLSIYPVPGNTSLDEIDEKSLREDSKISHLSLNRDYLPVNALAKQFVYIPSRTDNVYVLEGETTIENEDKDELNMTFDIIDASKNSVLELPYIFYPGYNATLKQDNEITNLYTEESENGFLKVTLPEDIKKGTITIKYTGTTIEKISYIISAFSLIGFISYIVYYKNKTKKEDLNIDERKN